MECKIYLFESKAPCFYKARALLHHFGLACIGSFSEGYLNRHCHSFLLLLFGLFAWLVPSLAGHFFNIRESAFAGLGEILGDILPSDR